MFPRPCAEFPNDNPAFYEVALSSTLDPPPALTMDPADLEAPPEIPEETSEEKALCLETTATAPTRDADQPPSDSFRILAQVLERVARDAGAAEGEAEAIPRLLGLARLDAAALPKASLEALLAGAQLESTPLGPRRTEAFTQIVRAWQEVLRGESDDLAMCGPATLDEWSADFLARVLGNPMLAPQLRRELRQRGVAAFGLVAEAA